MQMVFAGGTAGGERVIRAETLQEMLVAQNGDTPPDMDFRLGLGWHLFELRGLLPEGTRAAGHSGFDTIYTSFLLVLPDQEPGVAVLCNSDEGGSAVFNVAFRAIALMHEARTGIQVDPLPLPRGETASEVSLPAAWKSRLGKWECIDPGDDMDRVRSLELREQSGFLVLNVETFAVVSLGSLPWGAVLQPLSGTEATVPGLQHGRSAGETLRALEASGGEVLRFQGNLSRRAGG